MTFRSVYPQGYLWDDALGNIWTIKKTGLTEEAYRDTGHIVPFFNHNSDDELRGEIRIAHRWLVDSTFKFHLHTIPMASTGGNCYFTYAYTFPAIGEEVPAIASWTTGTVAIPYVAGDQYIHKVSTIFTVSGLSGKTASSILWFHVVRATSNPLDTYSGNKDHGTATANLGVMYGDSHILVNRDGTVTEYS